MTPALVYVAGSYRHSDPWEVAQNCRRAEASGREVLRRGAYPVIPHCNTGPALSAAAADELFLGGTLELMKRCDAVLLVMGDMHREASEGTKAEVRAAIALDKPLFAHVEELSHWIKERSRG